MLTALQDLPCASLKVWLKSDLDFTTHMVAPSIIVEVETTKLLVKSPNHTKARGLLILFSSYQLLQMQSDCKDNRNIIYQFITNVICTVSCFSKLSTLNIRAISKHRTDALRSKSEYISNIWRRSYTLSGELFF